MKMMIGKFVELVSRWTCTPDSPAFLALAVLRIGQMPLPLKQSSEASDVEKWSLVCNLVFKNHRKEVVWECVTMDLSFMADKLVVMSFSSKLSNSGHCMSY